MNKIIKNSLGWLLVITILFFISWGAVSIVNYGSSMNLICENNGYDFAVTYNNGDPLNVIGYIECCKIEEGIKFCKYIEIPKLNWVNK